ncbi:hypothetical protein M3Y99_00140400 [Aphelenchoides fujianensis]|nr:hypothetical protein M3Y99_00140400 [Aphelenchoides fujianensis]
MPSPTYRRRSRSPLRGAPNDPWRSPPRAAQEHLSAGRAENGGPPLRRFDRPPPPLQPPAEKKIVNQLSSGTGADGDRMTFDRPANSRGPPGNRPAFKRNFDNRNGRDFGLNTRGNNGQWNTRRPERRDGSRERRREDPPAFKQIIPLNPSRGGLYFEHDDRESDAQHDFRRGSFDRRPPRRFADDRGERRGRDEHDDRRPSSREERGRRDRRDDDFGTRRPPFASNFHERGGQRESPDRRAIWTHDKFEQ